MSPGLGGGMGDEGPRLERIVHGRLYSGVPMPHRDTPARLCSKAACALPAFQTLTYVYADAQAVVGPLSERKEPHTYDLCEAHSARLVAPIGWHIVRYRPYPEAI